MLTALVGTETLLIRRELDRILRESLTPAAKDFNFDQFDGKALEATRLIDVAGTYPILSPRRLVIVREAHEIRKSEMEHLGEFLPQLPPTTDLVLVAEKIDRRLGFWQVVEKKGEVREFKSLYPREVPGWMMQEARAHGYQLASDAAQWLSTAVGTDLGTIVATLEKLYLLKGSEKRIALNDVESCITASSWKNLFDLTNAVGERDLSKALVLFQRMTSSGESPIGMLVLLARHFRILSRVKEGDTSGITPYFLKDYQRQSSKFTSEGLSRKRESLFEVDRALKSLPIPSNLLFERLLIDLCR